MKRKQKLEDFFQNLQENYETETKIRRFFPKSSGKLSSGLIALIIVVPIVLVAITIGLILFLTRNKEIPKAPISNFTTTENVICN